MEQKAVCGGFYIGDGLEMDGKTLKATGGEGGGSPKIYPFTQDGADFLVTDAAKDLESIRAYGGLSIVISGEYLHFTLTQGYGNTTVGFMYDGGEQIFARIEPDGDDLRIKFT